MINNQKLFKLFLCLIFPISIFSQTATVSGSLQQWHKVALNINIPTTTFSESAATFKDHRVDVIFIDPAGKEIRVPAFYAADGNAANTGATSGSTFTAYLRPNVTGSWKYRVLYYKDPAVSIKWLNQLPAPVFTLNGSVGTIGSSNKRIPDLRAKGRLQYQVNGNTNQQRYLRFEGSGEYFLKHGPDSPENLLNYEDFDFDGTRNSCSRCTAHKYTKHAANATTTDPSWKSGKGKNIMGVLNYLKNQEMNAISMTLFGGDDPNVFPWTVSGNTTSYDVSKLAQWETVFDHAEKNGLLLHFKLSENENWDALSLTDLRVYYREMIARFGHHLAIEWNISEEYRGTAQSALARIDWLASLDPWQNHRVIHTYPGEHKKYQEWLDLGAKLTGASIQTSDANNYAGAFSGADGILTWINNSKKAKSSWVVSSDEQNTGARGVFTSSTVSNKSVVKEARTRILWKTLIAGGAGIMWYGGSIGDFSTEDFSRFDTLFKWTRYAISDFFKKNSIQFWNMENNDDLVSNSKAHCLASKGKEYVIYLENGGTTNIDLSGLKSEFNVSWFDPRNGGALQRGSKTTLSSGGVVSIGNPPSATTSDWVAYISINNPIVNGGSIPDPTTCKSDFYERNKMVIVEAENLNLSGTSWVKKSDRSGNTGTGHISWEGSNNFAKPGNEKLTAKIQITNPGKYRFQWRNTYGKGNITTEHNDSWLRFPDASDFYAEKGTSKVYPNGSGKTPNPAKGGGADGWFKVWLSSNSSWSWYSRTWDSNSHFIYVEFDKPGIYTMEISGRSQYHLIDRIILYQDGVNAQNTSLSETGCSSGTSPTNSAPTVRFSTPVANTKYRIGDAMTFTAAASDADGTISNVLFYANGVYLGADHSAPYTITQTATTAGPYRVTAIATDNAGKSTSSGVLTVTIDNKSVPSQIPAAPKVQLTGITEGKAYKVGDAIAIGATATDADGTVAKVVFLAKNVIVIGEDTTKDYSAIFRPIFPGTYRITAKVTDNSGTSTISAPINIVIKEDVVQNAKPKVTLTGIKDGDTFDLKGSVPISADATDADGRITKVVFYAKGVTNLGEEFVAPYAIKFYPAFTGTYAITARATDNDGNITISAPITINIADFPKASFAVAESETTSLTPIHDAYIDHSTGHNSSIIRIEEDRREAYLMFDTSSIEGGIEEVVLDLLVHSDSGSGTIQVFGSTSNSWTETSLNGANKPNKQATILGEVRGDFEMGQLVQIPIALKDVKDNRLTLIVTHSAGNDVAFASKENAVNTPPQLRVVYNPNSKKSNTNQVEDLSLDVYPNPTTDIAYLEGNQLEGSLVQLYSVSGALLYSEEARGAIITLPTATLQSGVYFIKTLTTTGTTIIRRLAVNH